MLSVLSLIVNIILLNSISGCVMPHSGGLYRIIIESGVSENNFLLSVRTDNARCDLTNADDESGRQRWIAIQYGDFWHFEIKAPVNSRDLLSVTSDGGIVDLYTHDDISGRQRWIIEDQDGYCHIKIYDGVSGGRSYLSAISNGAYVYLNSEDRGSGRQRWFFQEVSYTANAAKSVISDIVDNNEGRGVELVVNNNGFWLFIIIFVIGILLVIMNMIICYTNCNNQKHKGYKTVTYDTDRQIL